MDRRKFLVATTAGLAFSKAVVDPRRTSAKAPDQLKPIGKGKGVHPGRVVWVHDPQVLDWKGPGDGHWWESNHVKQDRANRMMSSAVCELTGEAAVPQAWSKLFRHLNQARGKGSVGYSPGEKIVIKPNWVGMIYRDGTVDPETYALVKRRDYMNTSPQVIIALLRQLVDEAGVKPADITVCDTLACLANEYYGILHTDYSQVRYEDQAGKFGRIAVESSCVPLYWSSRPRGVAQDYLPKCVAEAQYAINFATLKAHAGAGVTLCAKNHFGSLVRWPAQKGYYDVHPNCFAKETNIYRPQVDLMGHAHLGGKTALYLVDGLFHGLHPNDRTPRSMAAAPFNGQWPCSLFASQDPVAIDSVCFDFLWTEWTDFPRNVGVDDYLHEAALAHDPPSGTLYAPDDSSAAKRLLSLGVHEHWNNPRDRKYSRDLGLSEGIELVRSGPA